MKDLKGDINEQVKKKTNPNYQVLPFDLKLQDELRCENHHHAISNQECQTPNYQQEACLRVDFSIDAPLRQKFIIR